MRYPVQLDPRHLERLSGPLLTGVIELIWNSIDADASSVKVVLRDNGMGGVGEFEVADDGHGIDVETAKEGFLGLGRSWKAGGGRSRTLGRPLHGKEGRGRFKLFRHGGVARWESVSELNGTREKLRITVTHGEREIDIEELGSTDEPTGTRVLVSNFGEAPKGLTGQAALDRLLTTFVLPIEAHGVQISYDGAVLDPSLVREARDDLTVENSPVGPLDLTVIQWKRQVGQHDLHLCSSEGAVLDKVPAQVPTPGLHFTAYLRWDGFADHLANLAVADLDAGEVADVISAGRRRLEQHFADLLTHRQRRVISAWREEGVYPFGEAPASAAELAARQTFDVIALEAAETVNKASRVNRRLSLRLLREALEHNPGQIHRVVGEVLALPQDRLEDLTRLLERTSLTQIISASTSIADRLDFLQALSDLTSDPDLKDNVLERDHLHRILEEETWVFGEEYALAVSEAGLTRVLEEHIRLLGRDELAPKPGTVRDAQGKIRRVDLMLAASIPQTRDLREHLVVELKRPKVPIGPTELQQVKEYALTVAEHDRFDTARTRWEFWVVSTDVVGTAERERHSHGEPGLAFIDRDAKIRIWVKKWSEIIHDAEHRLKCVRDQLGVAPDQASALDYLQRVHAERLPDVITPAA